MFTFSGLDQKYLFGKFDPKIENCLFKMKFGTKINFYAKLGAKFKINY